MKNKFEPECQVMNNREKLRQRMGIRNPFSIIAACENIIKIDKLDAIKTGDISRYDKFINHITTGLMG